MPAEQPAPAPAQDLLDLAPCGLLRIDARDVILRANRTFCEWAGRPREEVLGRRLQDLLTVGGRIFHQTHLSPLLQMQGSVAEVKLELLRRDGQVVPIVLNARRHEGPEGAFCEVALFVARDRDRYERELVRARRRLESLVEEVRASHDEATDRAVIAEQMVGIVSHDLRNPLQSIQMGALLLSRGDATPHQLSVLGRILRAGERAHRLIADLLDFTQARLGKGIAVQPKPLALHTVIADVVDELAQAFPGRQLLHQQAGEGPCRADSERLAQLVGNLVGNAMAYSRPDSPVTVRSEITEDHFSVSVHNLGDPIPPDVLPMLFQPLVRGAAEGKASRSVGLGLFIVAEIAKAHGGRVAVDSREGEGTTFTVVIPRAG